jgi:hypothetical protein
MGAPAAGMRVTCNSRPGSHARPRGGGLGAAAEWQQEDAWRR